MYYQRMEVKKSRGEDWIFVTIKFTVTISVHHHTFDVYVLYVCYTTVKQTFIVM